MHVELKHTLTVDRNAWFIRLYAGVYYGRVESESIDPTFCSLFWGYLLMPLALIFLLVATPIMGLVNFISPRYASWRTRHKTNEDEREWLIDNDGMELGPKVKVRPRRDYVRAIIVKAIGGVAYGVSKTIMFAQAHKPHPRSHDRLVQYVRIGLLILAGIIAAGGTAFGLSLLFPVIIAHLALTGIIIGAALGVALVAVSAVYSMVWVVANGYMDWVPDILVGAGHGGKKGAIGAVHSVKLFGRVMLLGLVAVKSNTCPKIELVERKADG